MSYYGLYVLTLERLFLYKLIDTMTCYINFVLNISFFNFGSPVFATNPSISGIFKCVKGIELILFINSIVFYPSHAFKIQKLR